VLKKTRSILDEIDSHYVTKDRDSLLESRASHVIQGAINLLASITEGYDSDSAAELERRLINSIRSRDPNKFIRGIRRIRNESKKNNDDTI
jgi:hypothetical protein